MATSILHSSEETSFCDICRVNNKVTSVAVYYCEECHHELCITCLKRHRTRLVTKNHKVTKLQDRKESEFQVDGRRDKEEPARGNKEMGSNQSGGITKGVKGVTISPGPSTKSISNTPGKVYTTATLKKGINVALESDDVACGVWGIVLLQDRIVVSDRNNSKLKVFGTTSTFQFDYKCADKPFDIDMLDNTTVVSSMGCIVQVLSVGSDSMEALININTEYGCVGLKCHGGNIYCALCATMNSVRYSEVRIYSPDGTLKRKFDYLSDGKVVYNELQYITVNPQTGTLYVTDFQKGVLVLSTSGDVTAVMSPPQLKNPGGIAVDDRGRIYVCGGNSHNVIQMSADGNDAVEVLSANPRCKFAQCVKIYGNRMIMARRDSGTVYIYELS